MSTSSRPISRSLAHFIGASGVSPDENPYARRAGWLFELPMLMAALWILLSWWAQESGTVENPPTLFFDTLLWGLFVVESVVLSFMVTNTRQYLRGNWLNLVIILLGLPILFGADGHVIILRLLRLFAIIALLFHVGSGVQKLLSRNKLGATLAGSSIVIILSGIMMAALDPAIESPWDGIWWAWVTVTTVGYGDVVPVSSAGRAFGSLIILMGIGLFSMLTASFAALFISQQEEKVVSEEKALQDEVTLLRKRLEDVDKKLDKLLQQDRCQ